MAEVKIYRDEKILAFADKSFISKHKGLCFECKGAIIKGDLIQKRMPGVGYAHIGCYVSCKV